MRIAFVDTLFSWPPIGGADTDLFHTIRGIQHLGHDVHLFATKNLDSRERPGFDPADMPFPATRIDLAARQFNRRDLPERVRRAVDAWKPEAVYLGFGYFLKPYLAAALSAYPIAARLYAYELACPRDLRMFRDTPCTGNFLATPDNCRQCALEALAPEIKSWRFLAWAHEYMAARAYLPEYHTRLLDFVRQCRVVIVYNRIQREHLAPWHDDVRIVPGGVTAADFAPIPQPERSPRDRKVLLMTGRAEDPAKGFGTLAEAAEKLAAVRDDFEVRVTLSDPSFRRTWLSTLGWLGQGDMARVYREADICVVPSMWDEPFGIVAVEAMASGRPVVASRGGGLQEIVVDGETGFLFERGDSAALAERIARLLDDAALREAMGAAGHKRALQHYDWDNVIATHYPAILTELAR